MKNVLITGVSGMVGSHLADFLLKKTNWKIYGACRWRSPMDNVDHLLNLANKKNSRIKFVYGYITDSYSMIELIKTSNPDYVFHLAAQSYPVTSFTEANLTFNTNIIGTYNILNSIRFHKINPIIF